MSQVVQTFVFGFSHPWMNYSDMTDFRGREMAWVFRVEGELQKETPLADS